MSASDGQFAAVVKKLAGQPGVTHGSDEGKKKKQFGSLALKINGKIFAMLVNGKLVVKLPLQRVDALVASGAGERFDPYHGRPLREWLSLQTASKVGWLPLAKEAMEFMAKR